MRYMRILCVFSAATMVAAILTIFGTGAGASPTSASGKPDCTGEQFPLCAEVSDPEAAFGTNYYVGHDEPATLFYSNTPGSGNHMQHQLTIPTEPSGPFSQAKGYDFELRPAFW